MASSTASLSLLALILTFFSIFSLRLDTIVCWGSETVTDTLCLSSGSALVEPALEAAAFAAIATLASLLSLLLLSLIPAFSLSDISTASPKLEANLLNVPNTLVDLGGATLPNVPVLAVVVLAAS